MGKKKNTWIVFGVLVFGLLIVSVVYWNHQQAGETGNVKHPAKMNPVELTLFSDVCEWMPVDWELTDNSISKVISDQTRVRIETRVPAQDADKQLSLLLQKNQLPDLMIIKDPNIIRQLVSSGKVCDLDAFFDAYHPNSRARADFDPKTREGLCQRDGAWYAIPVGMDSRDLKEDQLSIIWNRKLADRYGIDEAATAGADSFIRTLKEVADREEVIPILVGGEEDGSSLLEEDVMDRLLREGLLDPRFFAYDSAQLEKEMDKNQVLCYIGNIAHMDIDGSEWVSVGAGGLLAAEVLDQEPESASDYGWPNLFVSTSCTDLEDAGKFVDFMISGQLVPYLENYQESYLNWWVYENPQWEAYADRDSEWQSYKRKIHQLRTRRAGEGRKEGGESD